MTRRTITPAVTAVFAAALDALFADAHLARDVVYTAEGGAPSLDAADAAIAAVEALIAAKS